MIKIIDVRYVNYGVSDPLGSAAFMTDFGLATVSCTPEAVVMRTASTFPYVYIGNVDKVPALQALGFEVATEQDLERASCIAGASPVQPLDRPGGGQVVRVPAPGGLIFELVHGVAQVDPLPVRDPLLYNDGQKKVRINTRQTPPREPCQALRLGHVSLRVVDVEAFRDWLVEHFGMLVSDTLLEPGSGGSPLGFFMRFDHGKLLTDHHTLLLVRGETNSVHHASFEVHDIDALTMGHEWLKARGRHPHWGMGRHVLGSQVFDYWWDSDGFRMEHYTDGDVWDNTVRGVTVEATNEQLWHWGPEVPETFFQEARYAEDNVPKRL